MEEVLTFFEYDTAQLSKLAFTTLTVRESPYIMIRVGRVGLNMLKPVASVQSYAITYMLYAWFKVKPPLLLQSGASLRLKIPYSRFS